MPAANKIVTNEPKGGEQQGGKAEGWERGNKKATAWELHCSMHPSSLWDRAKELTQISVQRMAEPGWV